MAATMYGEARSTDDLDIVIDTDVQRVRQLVARLKKDYYVDEDDAAEAVRHRTVFSAIHFDSTVRVDFFIADASPAVRRQLDRRRMKTLGETRVSFYA
ncbi:MAG TPA: hypothetical protein VE010_04140, partial [Thermoanaerobaculia bacterium]|nr:hypothetical protein [Thermoanaerobaculia bacterium]